MAETPNGEEIGFALLDNGADSIERALALLAYEDDSPNKHQRYKLAIILTAHGIEMLLKERLRKIHPAFVWENIDKYPSLSARTVGAELALERLKTIGKVTFSESHLKTLRRLRAMRNAIEHFGWAVSAKEAAQIVGAGLGFAIRFADSHLGFPYMSFDEPKGGTLSILRQENPEFARAFKEDEEHWNEASAVAVENLTCRSCKVEGAVSMPSQVCMLCGHFNSDIYKRTEDDWLRREAPIPEDDLPF
ncbi:MAG: hypothetical protein IV112_02515 [Methyloversatilis discipulorum]|uniref:hypothetical protein n=1 Tax=Methyloversatilis discipulorum TaxID=1119528 RepID=UPI0026ED792D|nr:hypothetical protein [Methyloversatilis discipulorum]MBT9515536.1 hypothetical protein [Methyloversatilis discipulorum]